MRLVLIAGDSALGSAVTQALTAGTGDASTFVIEPFIVAEVGAEAGVQRVLAAPAEVDCVLLDDAIPDADERLARLAAAEVPVLLLTGVGSEQRVSAPSPHQGDLADLLPRGAYDSMPTTTLDRETLAAKIRVVLRLHAFSQRARAAEAELRDSVERLRRAVAARDSVLAVVSHDLRGPLNNIELAMGLLAENTSPHQRALASASIHRAVARADRLIRDLLDVARLSGGTIELVRESLDPLWIVETAVADVRPAAEQHGQTLVIERGAGLAPILADRDRVVQVLDNLLRNAIKYGPREGTIRVEVQRRGDAVEIAVCDQGPGLDADARAHVFDRFWRGREGQHSSGSGSGLGLAIAQGLVHSHGGEIGVESTPGHGARFHFTIPLAP